MDVDLHLLDIDLDNFFVTEMNNRLMFQSTQDDEVVELIFERESIEKLSEYLTSWLAR